MGEDRSHTGGAVGLLQAACMSELRSMFIYGNASTMQIMAEALGLMLPGTALMPSTAPELKEASYQAGKQLMDLISKGIKTSDHCHKGKL